MSNGERISPLSFRLKYLKLDLAIFSIALGVYIFILWWEKSHTGIERVIWIVDRVGAAVPVAIVLTLFVELGGLSIMLLVNWYNESHKAKREKELEDAKEEGRRQGRAEAEAAIEAAQQESYNESAPDAENEPSSDGSE
jgi:hypothetical protein